MASPQCENGYTRLANELLIAMANYPFRWRQFRILMIVMRLSFGYQKKTTEYSRKEIARMLNMDPDTVSREVSKLVKCGILALPERGVLAIQKDYERWLLPDGTPFKNCQDRQEKLTKSSVKTDRVVSFFDVDKSKNWQDCQEKLTVSSGKTDSLVSASFKEKRKKKYILSGKVLPDDSHGKKSSKEKQPEKRKQERIPFAEIIEYLNLKAGTNFLSTTKATQQLIRARWREGFRVPDFKAVIDSRVARWKNNPDMLEYIRPATLFNSKKFEGYLQYARRPKKTEKRIYVEDLIKAGGTRP